MRKRMILLMLVFLYGCVSIHFVNEKGVKMEADDIRIKAATVKEARGYYWSRFEAWIPWRPKI